MKDFLIMFLVFLFVLVTIAYGIESIKKYLAIPKLEDYLKKNPDCGTGRGIRCFNCGSGSIRDWGYSGRDSSWRVHICNSCGKVLYRTKLNL